MTDREAFWEFARGFAVGLGIVGVFMLFVITLGLQDSPPNKDSSSRFQIVDKYRGCDIVRWEQKGLAEYKYFLDCG